MSSSPIAVADHVTRSFGKHTALDDVSLEVTAGESVGLLGPNGAGKSTLIALLCGLRRPDSGTVSIFGGDPRDPRNRRLLGVTPQATAVPETLKVRETIDLVAAHFADPLDRDETLQKFGLESLADKQCGALSGGQQRRLLVALALVGRPELVILDEPTTGLDVEARDTLWDQLRDYRTGGGTLIITSHYLAEIEALAERVVVMDKGSVIADGSLTDIKRRVDIRRIQLNTPELECTLQDLPSVVNLEPAETTAEGGRRITLNSHDADATVRALVQRDVDFSDLEVHTATLEEAFLAMTSKAAS
ncbi:ABC-2 type transport system ATP-binding protein [Antricoccus suffuscus]|uniref:ABC-2 type transport system ATP-binding protein n=1 Tax=Antricoccus suffuscus TaxID=1629062 RepID=A0A2T0ZYX7_9ACTN|nr:ABC transporter ATP-binding protein [Antricoccus suffuscus]PRZ41288.1 ABC-2 type transport system ATP-binding protein [Antricoccus suffuscus]